jgi:Ca2+-binding EF-hand superfamily protein
MGICQVEQYLTQERILSPPQNRRSRQPIEIANDELRQVLDKLFNSYDRNHDNYLDLDEIEAMMRHAHNRNHSKGNTKKEALDFIAEADKDGDGRIDK